MGLEGAVEVVAELACGGVVREGVVAPGGGGGVAVAVAVAVGGGGGGDLDGRAGGLVDEDEVGAVGRPTELGDDVVLAAGAGAEFEDDGFVLGVGLGRSGGRGIAGGVPELDGPVEVAEVEGVGGGVLVADLLAEVVLAGGHEGRVVGGEPAQGFDGAAFGRRQAGETELAGLLFGRGHVEGRVERGEEEGVAVPAWGDLGAEAEGQDHVVVGHVVEGVAWVEAGGLVEEPEGGGLGGGGCVGGWGWGAGGEGGEEGGDG